MTTKPHILIINPDQWRADVLGHLGNPAAVTPNLDRLVTEEAVSFANAYCQNPVCTPSRCSFMTGWYPHVRGHRTMFHMLQPDEPMLLRDLKQAGYFVWWGGKNDLVSPRADLREYCDVRYPARPRPGREFFPNPHGWADWRGAPDGDNYYSFHYGKIEALSQAQRGKDILPGFPIDADFVYDGDWEVVLGAIEQILNAPPGQPLCLFLALGFPHPPYSVEDPWFSAIERARLPERIPTPEDWSGLPGMLKAIHERQGLQDWTEDRWDELRATYYGMCARVDYQIGLLLRALKQAGLYDETAVLMFSDHGDFTGDYGLVEKTQNTFQDCLCNVPLIFKPPANLPVQPGVRHALVELVDVPATVHALAGLDPGYTHFGSSLLPLLPGEPDAHREAVFCEGGRLRDEQHAMELQSAEHQQPSGLYYPRMSVQRGAGPEHGKAAMCRTHDFKYVRRLYEEDELYDLRADPSERHNRIHDPALAPVLAEMKERLLIWYQQTADVVPWQQDSRH